MIKRYESWISFKNRKWQHEQPTCWSTGNFELPVETKTRQDPIGVSSYTSLYEVIVNETVCAVKEMHFMLVYAEDSKWKSVFLTECENRCKILHPNIVQFLGKSTSYPSERGKITMAGDGVYAYKSNWPDWEVPERRYSFALQFCIFMDVCQGLHFLHSQNIIHRDLHSSNGLLTKHLVAKISDLRILG